MIRLDKEENNIARAIWNLPWVPLEQPYQKGWKRSFVLRPDIRRSHQAGFFESLLKKINTTEYSPYKSFTKKKRKKGRKFRQAIEQELRVITHHLRHKICRLVDGEVKYGRYHDEADARFRNPYKQKPVHLILQMTGNEKEESWTR